ncbi:MAG TPA: 4-aminobutyrate--2-oxoglutarate transaminase [Enteractinococcus helveticum]|uniref:(S)-3-amino-2-methylpropionate transaminase n=1 Tax=Enteractinococcus helveticum TaxID=1837282 RepID=A0A921K829_9MICC|nr:4-aminobutyrate--2-oxoglutarate transaminase [Enteractinococcus helveticum]HJF15322.1 4-aminobutyrate--2-oxoglutarate transaminase [Enteractinococcus helveticum]
MTREPLEQSRKLLTELPGPKARQLREHLETYVPKAVSPSTPAFVTRAEGGIVEDVDGNRLIDLGSGIAVTTVGASHPKVVEAVKAQVENFTHTCFMVTPYESYAQLAQKLDEIVPISGQTRTVLLNSGAEAVENAVKVARAYTGKQAIAAFDNAYHGRTTLTMGLTAKNMPYKDSFGPFASELYRVPGSYPFRDGLTGEEAAARTIEALEIQIGANNLAAVIMEPIQGEGGFIEPAEGFLAKVIEWCHANGVLFIADEVQTGFVRTGAWFASETQGIEPDLITMAKGIAGGMPLSAVTGRAELMDSVHAGGLGGTYGGNPVAVAAGLASIAVMEEENLTAKALRIQEIITEHFAAAQQDDARIGDIRGRGAMMAVEFVDPETKAPLADLVNEVAVAARKQGVITLTAGTYGNVLRFLPPVVIGEDLLKEGLSVITDILAETRTQNRQTIDA